MPIYRGNASQENGIVVLGKNYSTLLGAIRGLGKEYLIDVYYIASRHHSGDVVKYSNLISTFYEHIGRKTSDIIQELLEHYGSLQKALLPTDDFTTSLIDLNYNVLSKFFRLPPKSYHGDGIVKLMDKANQAKLAQSYGLRVAKSWTVEYNDGQYIIPEGVMYPCFYKPLISIQGGKDGMKKCENKAELIDALASLSDKGKYFQILVQEYLDIDEEYSISGIAYGDTIYIPAILRKLCVSKAHKGTTVFGVVERIENLGETYNQLCAMLQDLSVYSIIDIELFRCGDTFVFNEINFRTSAVCYGAIAAGANIPKLFICALKENHLIIPDLSIHYGQRFLCEKAAYDDNLAGFLSKKQISDMKENADYYIIYKKEDKKPYYVFTFYILIKRIHSFLFQH